MVKVNNPRHENTDEATFAAKLIRFEKHKKTLLDSLRKVHAGGPKAEPFSEYKSWHALVGAANWYFRKKKKGQMAISAARRVERLLDLEKAIGNARGKAEKAMSDDIRFDLFKGWWCIENKIFPVKVLYDDRTSFLSRIFDEINGTVRGLATLQGAAKRAASNIRPRRGPTRGAGLLPMDDIIGLASVYSRSTGQKTTLGDRPFADFIDKFLNAVGQSKSTKKGNVVEALKFARKQARKSSGQ
jgi:hypothetical protein